MDSVAIEEPATHSRIQASPGVNAPSENPSGACTICGCRSPEHFMLEPSYIYTIGRVEARFPSLAIEKEFMQAAARTETKGKTDRDVLQAVLALRENRYLTRQLCWLQVVQGLETYILQPRDPADFKLLVESMRPSPSPNDIDVVIGVRGPISEPETCNGLVLPIVGFDQIYSFDRDSFFAAIPRPKGFSEADFAAEVFDRIVQMTDNAGATDENRATNYLVVRYPTIFARAAEEFAHDCSLSEITSRPAPLSGPRKIVDVVFTFVHRRTDFTKKFSVRVDVTEESPFLVTKLAPYVDR